MLQNTINHRLTDSPVNMCLHAEVGVGVNVKVTYNRRQNDGIRSNPECGHW